MATQLFIFPCLPLQEMLEDRNRRIHANACPCGMRLRVVVAVTGVSCLDIDAKAGSFVVRIERCKTNKSSRGLRRRT